MDRSSPTGSGLNASPLHPNCRCYTIPVDEDEDLHADDERLVKEPDGKYTKVPVRTTFNELKNRGARNVVSSSAELRKIREDDKYEYGKKGYNSFGSVTQHKRGKKVDITDQAISKVKDVAPKSFTDDNTSASTSAKIKLLQTSKDKNNSNEVACLLNLNENMTTNMILGNKESVDVLANAEAYHWLYNCPKRSIELIHNHPGLSYFSDQDLRMFFAYDSIRTMSIVTNRGKVWYISKMERFNRKKYIEVLNEALEKNLAGESLVDLLLKKCYAIGIERN